MSERREIPEPGELVYLARPSWAPAFFAAGIGAMLCGIYANGFIFPDRIYAIVGAIFFLAALRNLLRGAIRDYYRLPRRQKVRGAVLPVQTVSPPRRGLAQSGLNPEVAPTLVQTRTMSRIERTPTSSASSKTTKWRMPRWDISAAARSRLHSGAAAITLLM